LKDGMRPLRLAGAMKVAEGVTTLEEVLRSTPAWTGAAAQAERAPRRETRHGAYVETTGGPGAAP
jgi:hypothetical protein